MICTWYSNKKQLNGYKWWTHNNHHSVADKKPYHMCWANFVYVEWFSLKEWEEGNDLLHGGVDPWAQLEENGPAFLPVLSIQGEDSCLQGPEENDN